MHGRRTFLRRMPFVSALATPARPAQLQSLRGRLEAALSELEIVNTHEHIIPEKERTSQPVDLFTLASHYAIDDLISAGMSRDDAKLVADQGVPDAQRWRRFEPFWKVAHLTGYCQALSIAVRDLYGVDEISGATLSKINAAIRAGNKPGLYRHVLKERARFAFPCWINTGLRCRGVPTLNFSCWRRSLTGSWLPCGAPTWRHSAVKKTS